MVSAETDAAGLFFLFSSSALAAEITVKTTVVAVAKSSNFAGSFEPAFSILTKLSFLLKKLHFMYIMFLTNKFGLFDQKEEKWRTEANGIPDLPLSSRL